MAMRPGAILALAGVALAATLAQSSDAKKSKGPDMSEAKVKRGREIAPVELNLSGKNKKLVYYGSYIVNAQGGCNECHTNPSYAEGGDPFQGEPEQINTANYLAGGAAFGPVIRSRNITPDATGKPAGMTQAEFIRTLRTGLDLSGHRLQVMPWPVYGKMTDGDLKAIYEYLRAIPHAEPAAAQ